MRYVVLALLGMCGMARAEGNDLLDVYVDGIRHSYLGTFIYYLTPGNGGHVGFLANDSLKDTVAGVDIDDGLSSDVWKLSVTGVAAQNYTLCLPPPLPLQMTTYLHPNWHLSIVCAAP